MFAILDAHILFEQTFIVMQNLLPLNWIKIALVTLLILLAAASFFYNRILVEEILEHERASIELWAKSLEFNLNPIHDKLTNNLIQSIQVLQEIEEVPDSVLRMIEEVEATQPTLQFVSDELVVDTRYSIPTIVTDQSGAIVAQRFINGDVEPKMVERFAQLNEPIVISSGEGDQSFQNFVYFGESQTVQYLRYFPFLQFGFLALLIGIGYLTYRSINRSEKSNLWVGMAKEAAHQLGTPLSSMYGWLQLLKENNKEDDETLTIAYELEKDIGRIKGIAERFNKIGSEPELKSVRVEPIVDQVIDYMVRRLPQLGKNVDVRKSIRTNAKLRLNPELFQWAIENLIKNSMDAIKESERDAFISVNVFENGDKVIIDVEDSGAGIDRKYVNEIFKPGYSTKKRGWGLGLSLTKRIIEEYHGGKIFVLKSDLNKGTTIRITLPA
ncbi:ATP-binding protein [soil metagenome]